MTDAQVKADVQQMTCLAQNCRGMLRVSRQKHLSALFVQIGSPSLQATVREALTFSARLRVEESVTDAQVKAYVEEVTGIVELQPIQNKLVDMPKVSGLSVEQRKRLTIAVELVANPLCSWMDPPRVGPLYCPLCVVHHTQEFVLPLCRLWGRTRLMLASTAARL